MIVAVSAGDAGVVAGPAGLADPRLLGFAFVLAWRDGLGEEHDLAAGVRSVAESGGGYDVVEGKGRRDRDAEASLPVDFAGER